VQCQECQERPATFYFQQLVNGEKHEVHVCEVCAIEMGYTKSTNENYSLQDLLTGLFNFDTSQLGQQPVQQTELKKAIQCPKCEMTFAEFQKIGKFGCASCYQAFAEKMDPILRRVHSGNIQHSGKIPRRAGDDIRKERQIKDYRAEMKNLVEKEAFEEAAALRDKIKVLENEAAKEKEEGTE
jgi:protein arginine kinase activator